MAQTPLTSRPLDLVYFGFFVVRFLNLTGLQLTPKQSHIFASLCIDFQAIYPPALVPGFLRTFAQWYIHTSNDPFIGGMLGNDPLIWFKSFLCLEVYVRRWSIRPSLTSLPADSSSSPHFLLLPVGC
jgi:hypothetical protein